MCHRFFSKYRLDCHFQSQSGSRPKKLLFTNLQMATVVFSCTTRLCFSCLPLPAYAPTIPLGIISNKPPHCFLYTHLYFQNCWICLLCQTIRNMFNLGSLRLINSEYAIYILHNTCH
jgi:hypothetical protein